MIDKPLIEKKLRKIEEFLRELNTVSIESFDEFVGNIVTKRFIERNIELAIENMTETTIYSILGNRRLPKDAA